MAQIEKVMSIYYGSNKKPYKDEDRQISYPVLGDDLFIGENNTTKIRFFVDRIGGTQFVWLATIKKPDGSLRYEILDSETLREGYVDLDLASMYLDQQGAVFISLTGFTASDVNITEDNGVYVVNGTPQRLVTGVVKIMVNYAPQILNMGTDISFSQYQQILAQLSKKLGLNQAVVFYQDITYIASGEIPTSELANGQIAYDETTKWFYSWNSTSEQFNPIALKGGKNIYGAIPVIESGMSATIATLISKGYNKSLFCVADDNGVSSYIFSLVGNYLYAFNIGGGGYLQGNATDTSKTIAQVLANATTYYFELTSNKESTTLDSVSSLKYPSSKATANYVKANAIASFTFDSSTYQIKFFNGNGTQVGSTIDLPVESVVVNGTYDSTNKQIILTLQNGNTITISVSDLVSGLIPTSDIVDNLNSTDSTKVLSAKQGRELNQNKVAKVATANQVYGTNGSGAQTTYTISTSNNANTVAQRDSDGHLTVSNPTSAYHSANKNYVDGTCEKVANKVTSLSSSSTDTQFPSAKCVFDNLKEIREIATGCATSYLTSVNITESLLLDVIDDGYGYYFSSGVLTQFANQSDFMNWKSTKTINNDVFASTNEQLDFATFLTSHYCVVYKDDKFICLDIYTYNELFKDGDNLFVTGDYFDRWYFNGILEINNGGSPIINVTTLTSTTPSQNLNSLVTYKCTNALTSLTISGLTIGTNDNNPTWQVQFVADTGFAVTFASGITWKYGTPTFNSGEEYTIVIEKRINNEYYAYLL